MRQNNLSFLVKSRKNIETNPLPLVPHIIISINDVGDTEPNIPLDKNTMDITTLFFEDIGDLACCFGKSPKEASCRCKEHTDLFFTPGQADQIWAFVFRHFSTIQSIVVHCAAGISRSAGVASALCWCLDGKGGVFNHPPFSPNRFVEELLIRRWKEVWHKRFGEQPFEQEERIWKECCKLVAERGGIEK